MALLFTSYNARPVIRMKHERLRKPASMRLWLQELERGRKSGIEVEPHRFDNGQAELNIGGLAG